VVWYVSDVAQQIPDALCGQRMKSAGVNGVVAGRKAVPMVITELDEELGGFCTVKIDPRVLDRYVTVCLSQLLFALLN
jgi:hypothetical protein